MKRVFTIFAVLMVVVMSFVACGGGGSAPAAKTPGKVAIITNTVSQNEEEFRSAEAMKAKYGDRVIHALWPDNFMAEQEQMVSVLSRLAADNDIKAIVINQAVPGTNPAVDKFLETRNKNDVLIIYSQPQENPPDVARRADIVLQPDEIEMGNTIPQQAKTMGAKVFVHYSFPRHMSIALLAGRRELMRKECAALGIQFVDATAPDPTSDVGMAGAQMYILEDVPKMVAQYGKDTAFFSTNCGMQVPLIKACFDNGAMYPQPCCPSPYHGFPAALGINVPADMVGGMQDVINQTHAKIKAAGLGGRFSTWPVPAAMMCTVGATEYAFLWMDGKTNGKFDPAALTRAMSDYANVDITLKPYDIDGVKLNNYFFYLIGFLTYGI
jgi:predicted small lipoprotein YifL